MAPMTTKEAAELRRRLSYLGRRHKNLHPGHIPSRSPLRNLPPGREVDSPLGTAYLIENCYPLEHMHGERQIADALEYDPSLASDIVGQSELSGIPLERLAFLDTETTGLAGGAGTLVFLVGMGVFEEGNFRLRQYFLRDPSEEAGMLGALQDDLEKAQGLVTYNGRAFDVPLLDTRYMIGLRRRLLLTMYPQIDLLHLTRRLWRRALPNCTLNTVERQMLGVNREESDVPGRLIPEMYLRYLRTGDAADMARVVYHNAIDILSLVTLMVQVQECHQQQDPARLSASEALAVGKWHQNAGRFTPAEAAYQMAIKRENADIRLEALRRYTAQLKRLNRYEAASEGWKEWHAMVPDDPRPCVELAKYYEWHARDYGRAQKWAQEALICLTHWPPDWRRERAWSEIEHRLARLARKRNPEM